MRGDLERVLRHYRVGELRAARRAERGFVNDNWIVDTTTARLFVKRRHPLLRQPDLIRAQHSLIRRLRRSGFPAPTIVPTVATETFLVIDGDWYEIQEYIEGTPYDHDQVAHLEEAALTLGRYHTLVEGFAPRALDHASEVVSPGVVAGCLTDLITAWQLPHDPSGADIAGQLEAEAAGLAARFSEHCPLHHLVIHGDYYADNLIFNGDQIVGVVDYDKACWQPRVRELAEALIYFSSPRRGHMKHIVYSGDLCWEPFSLFLHGYAETATLDDEEITVLPDYISCIWLSFSLLRLTEKERRPEHALEALQEVLALASWARANVDQMRDAASSAVFR
jgi:homoserine kinase type II